MKKYLIILLPLILSACAATRLMRVPFKHQNFSLNQTLTATVGSVMTEIESGQTAKGEDSTKELTSFQKSFQRSATRGFAQELIYLGKAGNVVNIAYKEYNIKGNDKYIRNEFSQNLQYDLSESKIISFRSLKIEIIEANSSRIKYKVIAE